MDMPIATKPAFYQLEMNCMTMLCRFCQLTIFYTRQMLEIWTFRTEYFYPSSPVRKSLLALLLLHSRSTPLVCAFYYITRSIVSSCPNSSLPLQRSPRLHFVSLLSTTTPSNINNGTGLGLGPYKREGAVWWKASKHSTPIISAIRHAAGRICLSKTATQTPADPGWENTSSPGCLR